MSKKLNLFNAALVAAALGLAAPLLAGPVADKAAEVEAAMAAGDSAAALTGASEIVAQVWEATPEMGIRQALLVAEPSAGYGIYNPRPNNQFKLGEPVYVYAEPFGFAYGSPGEGLFGINFTVDLRVLGENGDVLGEVPGVANLDLTSRFKIREFPANVTYTLNGVPPGIYVLETTLHDKNSAKIGTFQNTIEIVE